jgi:hypothetical protein
VATHPSRSTELAQARFSKHMGNYEKIN